MAGPIISQETANNYGNIFGVVNGDIHYHDAGSNQNPEANLQKKILDSLFFRDYRSRQEQVVDAYVSTFEWIFGRHEQSSLVQVLEQEVLSSATSQVIFDDFAQWLEKGDSIYWINGKAGSGKSTLMSFVVDHPTTHELLRIWAGDEPYLTPKFFFWLPGSLLQKNIEGLLRSLLYQILSERPALCDVVAKALPPAEISATIETYGRWTEKRLRLAMKSVLEKITTPICFFIDGLDEYQGETNQLIDLCLWIAAQPKVKICISSRPEPTILPAAFSKFPKLRLQDLNKNDMRIFVKGKLSNIAGLEGLYEPLVKKSEGIFLWTSLVCTSILKGYEHGERPEELAERLEKMPQGLDGMYTYTLVRIENESVEVVSEYFQYMALGSKAQAYYEELGIYQPESQSSGQFEASTDTELFETNIVLFLLIFDKLFRDTVDVEATIDRLQKDHNHLTSSMSKRLTSQSSGILEVTESNLAVTFLHRTASEFLDKNEAARKRFSLNEPPSASLCQRILSARPILTRLTDSRNFADMSEAPSSKSIRSYEAIYLTTISPLDSEELTELFCEKTKAVSEPLQWAGSSRPFKGELEALELGEAHRLGMQGAVVRRFKPDRRKLGKDNFLLGLEQFAYQKDVSPFVKSFRKARRRGYLQIYYDNFASLLDCIQNVDVSSSVGEWTTSVYDAMKRADRSVNRLYQVEAWPKSDRMYCLVRGLDVGTQEPNPLIPAFKNFLNGLLQFQSTADEATRDHLMGSLIQVANKFWLLQIPPQVQICLRTVISPLYGQFAISADVSSALAHLFEDESRYQGPSSDGLCFNLVWNAQPSYGELALWNHHAMASLSARQTALFMSMWTGEDEPLLEDFYKTEVSKCEAIFTEFVPRLEKMPNLSAGEIKAIEDSKTVMGMLAKSYVEPNRDFDEQRSSVGSEWSVGADFEGAASSGEDEGRNELMARFLNA